MIGYGYITAVGYSSLGADSLFGKKSIPKSDHLDHSPFASPGRTAYNTVNEPHNKDVFDAFDKSDENAIRLRRINYQLDQGTRRPVIRVIDAVSREVIQEMPSEELQKLSYRVSEMLGRFIDMEA